MSRCVYITGLNGFVGGDLCKFLLSQGYEVRGSVRDLSYDNQAVSQIDIKEFSSETDWKKALKGVDCIVHTAGVTSTKGANIFAVNTDATLKLARDAVSAGVKRLIFLSSAKVNGEVTYDKPFAVNDLPNPQDDYALSKLQAEEGLRKIAKETGLEVICIRPPMVYGNTPTGNLKLFALLIKWRIPIPLGSVKHNKRSLVNVGLLSRAIREKIDADTVSGVSFVRDEQDYSTREIVEKVGEMLKKKPFLISIPEGLLKRFFKLIGQASMRQKLMGNLQVKS